MLDVAGALLAEQAFRPGVSEVSGLVPCPSARRQFPRQEDLRFRPSRACHRDFRMRIEQGVQVGSTASLCPNDDQVPAHWELAGLRGRGSGALTGFNVRMTYSPSIDSRAIVKPLKIASRTTRVVHPATCVPPMKPRTR